MNETARSLLSDAESRCFRARTAAVARTIVRAKTARRAARVGIAWRRKRRRVRVALRLDLVEVAARPLLLPRWRSGKAALAVAGVRRGPLWTPSLTMRAKSRLRWLVMRTRRRARRARCTRLRVTMRMLR